MNNKYGILIHALFLNSLSLSNMKRFLEKKGVKVFCFEHKSTKFNDKVLYELDNLVTEIIQTDPNAKITIIGHSMGGLIGRLFLSKKQPQKEHINALITIGTPHNGSQVGKNISNSAISFILGTSGQSGITEEIEEWKNDYPLYCIAGVSNFTFLTSLLTNKKEDSDGTVFVSEAYPSKNTELIILPDSLHTQMIFDNRVFEIIERVILKI